MIEAPEILKCYQIALKITNKSMFIENYETLRHEFINQLKTINFDENKIYETVDSFLYQIKKIEQLNKGACNFDKKRKKLKK